MFQTNIPGRWRAKAKRPQSTCTGQCCGEHASFVTFTYVTPRPDAATKNSSAPQGQTLSYTASPKSLASSHGVRCYSPWCSFVYMYIILQLYSLYVYIITGDYGYLPPRCCWGFSQSHVTVDAAINWPSSAPSISASYLRIDRLIQYVHFFYLFIIIIFFFLLWWLSIMLRWQLAHGLHRNRLSAYALQPWSCSPGNLYKCMELGGHLHPSTLQPWPHLQNILACDRP